MSLVVCGLLCDVCCLLIDVRCSKFAVCFFLLIAIVCCLLCVVCLWFVVRGSLLDVGY